jgi:DNA helicase II / ATP-dependent DNA helicase PcrA
MFVAATRAKSNLVFNSFRTNEHGKEVLPSPLIHEVPVTEADESKMNIIEVIENSTNWPELDHGQEKLLLKPLVENYRLSVTHLLNFLNLEKGGPQYFLERNLLRLPDLKSPVLAYGTAIHSSLKLAQQQVNLKKTDINKVLDQFETELKKQQLEKTEEDRYLVQGRKLLTELINEKLQLRAGSVAEREISDVRIGDAVISGNLDRIDTTQKGLTIVDYKTGSPLKSKLTTTSKSAGLKAFKHRTQLIFYALLAQEKGLVKPNQMVTGQMIYVEADSDKDFIRQYTPTDEDLKQMKQLIQAVWKHIQAVDWPDISTYSTDLDGTQKFIDHLLADS